MKTPLKVALAALAASLLAGCIADCIFDFEAKRADVLERVMALTARFPLYE